MAPRWSLAVCWAVLLAAAAASPAPAAPSGQPPLPAEVVVSSDAAYVKGGGRADRLLSGDARAGVTVVGADGIPVVYGVRVHETEAERNEPVWRNARVVDNKLFIGTDTPPPPAEPQTEAPETETAPPATTPAAAATGASRQGRILSYGSGAQLALRRTTTSTLPPFYYQSFYDPERPTEPPLAERLQPAPRPSVSSQAFKVVPGPNMSGQAQAGLEPEYKPTTPQAGAAATTTPPVYEAYLDHGFNRPVGLSPGLRRPDSQLHYSYTPENKLQHSYTPNGETSGDQGAPGGQRPAAAYQRPTTRPPITAFPGAAAPRPARKQSQFEHRFQAVHVPSQSAQGPSSFRFPSASSGGASAEKPAGQILSPGSYALPEAATQFQNSVDPFSGRPVSPDQFKIKQMAFQSVPGGPIVNIPVPIPNGQKTKPSRKPTRRLSFLSGLFGGSKRPSKDRYSQQQPLAGSAPSYPSAPSGGQYYPADPSQYYPDGFRRPTLYDTLTDPIRKLGENVIEFTKPVTQPLRDATDRLTEELGLASPAPTDQPADKQGVGPDGALLVGGLVASAGALAGLSFLVYANTVTNSTHYIIGRRRRSLDGAGDEDALLENLVDGLEPVQSSFIGRLRREGFQRWSRGPCAKRLFCDFMTGQDGDTVRSIGSKVTTFLSYLDKGEPDGLMTQARQLHKAIEQRECELFSCGGDTVDPSQVASSRDSGSGRGGGDRAERGPTEPRPR